MTNSADTAPPRPSGCTALRLRKAARRISQIYDQHLETAGLTITQYGLLAQIRSLEGISVGALAEKMVMDPTTLTRNLRPIEREGLVTLTPDPRDKRARCLHLTEKGLAAHRAARGAWAGAQKYVEDTLGAEDAIVLHDALDRMLDRLAK
jgi:DNA-binding MarR family transcriptional regulator